MSISTLISSIYSSSTWRNCLGTNPKTITTPATFLRWRTKPLQFNSSIGGIPNASSSFTTPFKISISGAKLEFSVKAENGGETIVSSSSEQENEEKELEELRGQSTMPDRFQYLTKEVPSPRRRWPWLIAVPFLIYSWRSVLWELSNWRNLVLGIFQFFVYPLKLLLALVYCSIGDFISYTFFYLETAVYAIRSFYSSIVTSAPLPELTFIIMLTSAVLAIGKTASPNSLECQPYLLTVAGIVGYGAVRGVFIEPIFWLMLVGLFIYCRLFKNRDFVTSTLPVAAVLASVGEPWVRVLAVISFTTLAIHHHSTKLADGAEVDSSGREVPLPLLGLALVIGIHVAAKWAGYRHLTWLII